MRGAAAAIAALFIAACAPALGGGDGEPPECAALSGTAASAQTLRAAAAAAGGAPVLVLLAVDTRPESGLEPTAAAAQRGRIASAQDTIIAALEDTDTRVLRRFQRVPQLALRVDEEALCRLLTMPLVERVEPDRADSPGGG